MERNVFVFWIGDEYKLIKILRTLIFTHLENTCQLHFIHEKNLNEYLKDPPEHFDQLCPAHQADYLRVNLVCERGGIWLDSDTLVLGNLNGLFQQLEEKDGFFIKQNNEEICNGVFGSKANTPLMQRWKRRIDKKLELNRKLGWEALGGRILQNLYKESPEIYENYTLFEGLDTMYPVNWPNCVEEFIEKPYENYTNLIRDDQPLIVLVRSVYKALEHLSEEEILNARMPLNYFIHKSRHGSSQA